MASKITGNVALDKALTQINKTFSREFITTKPTITQAPVVSTGSLGLDCAIGGGLPENQITEIYGLESSGKTSLMLSWAARVQKKHPDRYVLLVDKEHSMTASFINGFGINPEKLLYSRPFTTSEALDSILDLVRTGEICFLGLDSIGTLTPPKSNEKSVTASNVGGVSKILTEFFNQYDQIGSDNNCTSVFINQLRYNPGVMFGNPETTPGGTALKYHAWLRLRAGIAKPSTKTPGAFVVDLSIKKNKIRPPVARKINFDFVYAKGVDPILDTLNAGKDLGVLAFAGQALKMLDETNTMVNLCNGGAEGFKNLVISNPAILDKIAELCIARANDLSVDPINSTSENEIDDNGE